MDGWPLINPVTAQSKAPWIVHGRRGVTRARAPAHQGWGAKTMIKFIY